MHIKQHRVIDIDHDDIILRTFILFAQTANAVLKYVDAYFYKEAHLSPIKFVVLRILADNNGTMAPSEIAQYALRERHDISTLVDRMERDGLVKTKRNDKDRRFVNIILSDKGTRVLTKAMPVARKIVNQVMLSIYEGDAVLLEKSLRILRQNAHDGLEHVAKRAQSQP